MDTMTLLLIGAGAYLLLNSQKDSKAEDEAAKKKAAEEAARKKAAEQQQSKPPSAEDLAKQAAAADPIVRDFYRRLQDELKEKIAKGNYAVATDLQKILKEIDADPRVAYLYIQREIDIQNQRGRATEGPQPTETVTEFTNTAVILGANEPPPPPTRPTFRINEGGQPPSPPPLPGIAAKERQARQSQTPPSNPMMGGLTETPPPKIAIFGTTPPKNTSVSPGLAMGRYGWFERR